MAGAGKQASKIETLFLFKLKLTCCQYTGWLKKEKKSKGRDKKCLSTTLWRSFTTSRKRCTQLIHDDYNTEVPTVPWLWLPHSLLFERTRTVLIYSNEIWKRRSLHDITGICSSRHYKKPKLWGLIIYRNLELGSKPSYRGKTINAINLHRS